MRFETKATRLVTDDRGAVTGVVVRTAAGHRDDRGRRRRARRPAASRPTPRCARAISGPTGSWRGCAARPTTPATASAWRSTSARCRGATGAAATPCSGTCNAPWHGDRKVGDNFQKHSYPARAHRQPQGRALRRRGRRLPQLHLREVRPRGHRAAAPHRVPDLRPEGASTSSARNTASARSPRPRTRRSKGWRASSRSTSTGSCATVRAYNAAVQPGNVQSGRQGRQGDARASRRPSRTGRSRSTRRPTSASR